MGHVHLRALPGTKRWRSVIGLLEQGAADDQIIAASARAAENDLRAATRDPVYVEAVRLLLTIPHAARADDFGAALRQAEIDVQSNPTLIDLAQAATRRLDQIGSQAGQRTDLGEIAGRALSRALYTFIGDQLPGLLETTPADVKAAARKLSYAAGIAAFTRGFFADVVSGSLSYWLDRTLATMIGPDQRFARVADRAAFDSALGEFCAEATRIIKEFAGGWYGKTLHEQGRFDSHRAAVFGAVALKKVVEELHQKGLVDA